VIVLIDFLDKNKQPWHDISHHLKYHDISIVPHHLNIAIIICQTTIFCATLVRRSVQTWQQFVRWLLMQLEFLHCTLFGSLGI